MLGIARCKASGRIGLADEIAVGDCGDGSGRKLAHKVGQFGLCRSKSQDAGENKRR